MFTLLNPQFMHLIYEVLIPNSFACPSFSSSALDITFVDFSFQGNKILGFYFGLNFKFNQYFSLLSLCQHLMIQLLVIAGKFFSKARSVCYFFFKVERWGFITANDTTLPFQVLLCRIHFVHKDFFLFSGVFSIILLGFCLKITQSVEFLIDSFLAYESQSRLSRVCMEFRNCRMIIIYFNFNGVLRGFPLNQSFWSQLSSQTQFMYFIIWKV